MHELDIDICFSKRMIRMSEMIWFHEIKKNILGLQVFSLISRTSTPKEKNCLKDLCIDRLNIKTNVNQKV